jgi:two-component system nitrogen regulation sensor histidine kinase NtrY
MLAGAIGGSLPSNHIMFRIKSFQRRILLALLIVALIPTAVLLLSGVLALREVVDMTGTAGPWSSLAESGQVLFQELEDAELENPDVAAAAAAHQEALSESLRFSRMFSLVANRFMGRVSLLALVLALAVLALSYWAARQLSRGFSRPIRDLVGWTDMIARNEPLPPPDPRGHRGVQEFALLRDALRKMALELEERRREAIHAAKLRSWTEMARRVAHELKNPLTPMKMAAATVTRMEGKAAQEAGAVLLEEIGRLDEMARTFSQFGRMPEGPASQVDVTELLEGLVVKHHLEGSRGSIGAALVEFQADPDLPLVRGHYDALLRCFRNLLLNAMEAAGPAGEVRVTATGMEDGVRVEIRDSGAGIGPDDLERIWDPEFTTKSSGTGLGLPMALQTIRFHHGRIEGGNHPEGGAVFVVELPVTWDPETPSPGGGEPPGVV